ncbi:MAG: hypothetical protein ACKV1O_29560 [Saprospiraceae bacterium]
MGKDKKNQDKPGVRSDEKTDEDFNKKAPNPSDPDFQIPAPEMDFPNIGDFQKKPIDDTIIGDIDGRDNDEREDEPLNKEV